MQEIMLALLVAVNQYVLISKQIYIIYSLDSIYSFYKRNYLHINNYLQNHQDWFRSFRISLRFPKLCLPQVDCDLGTFLEKRFALVSYFVFSYNLTRQKLFVRRLVEPFLSK